jgi:tetratricopeptide (TPR) repeat protein
VVRIIIVLIAAGVAACAQTTDPAYAPLEKAYAALRANRFDEAVASFQRAIALAPQRAAIRKDLAYALLKIGENEAARDQFAEAMRLDPADQHVALEYAFLCYETKQQPVARRVFDRIRKTGNTTAEEAFQNIDRPLADGIARWRKALEMSPGNFSAHEELARLAEQRDELALAADHYEKAWRIKPEERALLLDLGRVWKALGRSEDAMSALLAASRSAQPRVAERARELLPSRYPYVYEFQNAITLDPNNVDLRRELAYLHLEMDHKTEAEDQFRAIHQLAPNDLLSTAQLGFLLLKRRDIARAQPLLEQVLKGADDELADRVRTALNIPQTLRKRGESTHRVSDEAKIMAEKSLKAGYLKDALKYLTVAQEADPLDFAVMLKLGWTYNNLHEDKNAVHWFGLASKSPDPAIATEATKAYNNLKPSFQRFRFTAWLYPFYSSRWKDAFGYAQMKEEIKLGSLPLRAYLSVRFVGDVRGKIGPSTSDPYPAYLSESSAIFGVGLATATFRGLTGWAEAGESVKYLTSRSDVGAAIPDYRGGLSYAKALGHPMGSHGLFAETNDDGVFVSRFQNDMLLYSQNRVGYTIAPAEDFLGGLRAQVYWNVNVTADREHQYWANYVETGPGLRFRSANMPRSLLFSVNVLRGAYLVNAGNPRRPNFFDYRVGFWYAFTR